MNKNLPLEKATKERIDAFKDMISYFWLEKGDPERFTGWDEEFCAQVWPEFLHVWKQHKITDSLLDTLARNYDR